MKISSASCMFFGLALGLCFSTTSWADDTSSLFKDKNARVLDLLGTLHLPANLTLYNVILRQSPEITTSDAGKGAYQTCDSSEIAAGGLCEEVQNGTPANPNALLTSGVKTSRSVICKWKNQGTYRASATCLAVRAVVGDSENGVFDPDHPENIK